MSVAPPPALRMRAVSKRYGSFLAVDSVDLEVRAGEIHALMGENGAGKSTLMKLMAGAFADYSGRVEINGVEVQLHSPRSALRHGIGMVYQELSVARPLTLADNLLAGHLPLKWGCVLDRAAMLREATRRLASVGLEHLHPDLTIEEISQHEAQLVEIAKVLGNRPHILILDEPTSALSRAEVERLFSLIQQLKAQGLAIIYISHFLTEIFQIADRVTVLRDGRVVATQPIAEATSAGLVQMMVGKPLEQHTPRDDAHRGPILLKAIGLTRIGFFHGVSLDLHAGEVIGIAGLSGAGRTELARSLCGLDPLDRGTVELQGRPLKRGDYAAAVASGLVYLSEDRKHEGLFLDLSLALNITAGTPAAARGRSPFPNFARERSREMIEQLQIAARSERSVVGTLSGGNQQKVLLARGLVARPKVLILDEPTRGVDVNARLKIHATILQAAQAGMAVIVISTDLPELIALADRTLIMRSGRLTGELPAQGLSEEALLLAINGDPAHAS